MDLIKDAIRFGLDSVSLTSINYKELDKKGLEILKKNQFGDTCLRIDWECEEAVINYFKNKNFPIRIISEEHGTIDVTENPVFLDVLDGIDGTAEYIKDFQQGRFGTMLGIFSNLNPTYEDSILSGIMEHASEKLYYGSNKGSFLIMGIDDREYPIRTSNCKTLDEKTRIFVDENFGINKKAFSKILDNFETDFHESSAVLYADIAQGNIDLLLECTRKKNLEIASAYKIVKESGGVIFDLDGNDIGNKKYLEFGQKEMIPVITAATPELAKKVVEYLK